MIIFDTETTGLLMPSVTDLVGQPSIIDIACIKVDDEDGRVLGTFQRLINPGCSLSPEITKITGYTDDDLKGAPTFAQIKPALAEFFLGQRKLLAHNLTFDLSMLRMDLERLGAVTAFPWPPVQVCTVQLYVEEFGKRPKLTQLYEAKLGRKLAQKHTAMADAEALLEIVQQERLYAL